MVGKSIQVWAYHHR